MNIVDNIISKEDYNIIQTFKLKKLFTLFIDIFCSISLLNKYSYILDNLSSGNVVKYA